MKVNPIIRFAVERRVTMAMAVLGVLVLGWLSLTRLPLEFLPTFSSSYISVNAPYPSSSPVETERRIVRPLEDSLGTINGVETLTANATSSSGSVSLRFVDGTDMDLAAVDVRDRIDRVRHRLPADLELPAAAGLHVNIYRDNSADVRNGIGELRNTGLLGGAPAVLFMYLFLRRVRSTLLVAIAIPVSVVVTFVFMYLSRQAGWTDLTLNIMSLMGLMLSIGMLVDNSIAVNGAIVLVDYANQLRRQGLGKLEALAQAGRVRMRPILMTSLTTIFGLLPMALGLGEGAELRTPMALTVIGGMITSTLLTLPVVPAVYAILDRRS